MRAQAIVYRSNTGFTKQYAEMLSQQTGLPAYDQKRLKDELPEGTSIVYMGWVRIGRTQGFKRARKKFNIVAICPVGMGLPNPMAYEEATRRSKMDAIFCLHGGFEFHKLRGLDRQMMRNLSKNLRDALGAMPERSESQEVMYNLATNGGSYVDQKYIDPLVQWLNGAELTEIVRPGCPDNPKPEEDEAAELPEAGPADAEAAEEREPADGGSGED
jgi:hypothetical protein